MSQTVVRTLTMSLDTNAYANGDVIAATQELPLAVKVEDGWGMIESLTVIDNDDQGQVFDVWVMDSNVAMGTENSAPNISDADAVSILGRIPVAAADYVDLGGSKVASLKNIGLPIKPANGSTSIYVAIVNGTGTPTFTAAGIKLRFGIVQG